MFVKSFFNPFSMVLLALAFVSLMSDVVFASIEPQNIFTPAVLLAMWLAGGLVRYAYETGAKRTFNRHMASSAKRLILKRTEGLWVYVSPAELQEGDLVRLGSGDVCPVDVELQGQEPVVVSEASLTGESGVGTRGAGQAIAAGTTIVSGKAEARVTAGYVESPIRMRSRRNTFSEGAKDICLVLVRVMLVVAPIALLLRGIAMGEWDEAILFALSAAVGLVPEMLPVVTGVCLSSGARRLKRQHVIAKDVDSMEALGGVDVICMDKTGTLTSDEASLEYFTDILGNESMRTLQLAYVECSVRGEARNQLDEAILRACENVGVMGEIPDPRHAFSGVGSDPFEHGSRYSGVKVQAGSRTLAALGVADVADVADVAQARGENAADAAEARVLTIVKGEVEAVCRRCSWADFRGEAVPMDEQGLAQALALADDMRSDGIKVLAVAYGLDVEGWEQLTLCGFLAFFDAPKQSARRAVEALSGLGVAVKVLTGDSAAVAASVCGRLGIPAADVTTGRQLAAMSEDEVLVAVDRCAVFAELSPMQKAQVVSALRVGGRTVGYLGDGLNDLPAIQASDVGIVVDSAAAEAKAVADVVLEQKDLGMVARGVEEGRRAFANATKYIRIASSSNFGNVCSIAIASLFLPVLPAIAGQLLVLNLVYDATCLALTRDHVAQEEISKPRAWSGRGLARFMGAFGPVSTAFDLLTFALLFFFVCPLACGGSFWQLDMAGQVLFEDTFQAGWLLQCAWTQSLVILLLRTGGSRGQGVRPCRQLVAAVTLVIVGAALLLATPAAELVGMAGVPTWFLPVVALETLVYLATVLVVKRWYLRRFGKLF